MRALAAKLNTECQGGSFETSDGMRWTVNQGDFNPNAVVIVNVNPQIANCEDADERPACARPNIFSFNIANDGSITINGHLAPQYIREHNNTKQAKEFN